MSTQGSSAAARLYAVLDAAQTAATQNWAIKVVWAKTLGVSISDIPTLLERLSDVIKLPGAVRQEVKKHDYPEELLWFMEDIETGLNQVDLEVGWGSVSVHLTPENMKGLMVCVTLLATKGVEPELSEDQLEKLKKHIEELSRTVRASDFDPVLKDFLLRQLNYIDEAIKLYWINGIEPIQNALAQMIGTTVTHESQWRKTKGSEFGKKFITFLSIISTILNIVVKIPELPGSGSLALDSVVTDVDFSDVQGKEEPGEKELDE